MKWALGPLPPLQPISFCVSHATFWMVRNQYILGEFVDPPGVGE